MTKSALLLKWGYLFPHSITHCCLKKKNKEEENKGYKFSSLVKIIKYNSYLEFMN